MFDLGVETVAASGCQSDNLKLTSKAEGAEKQLQEANLTRAAVSFKSEVTGDLLIISFE